MKKVTFVSILSVIFMLSGCTKNNNADNYLKILTPSGAPSLAFYDQSKNSHFETTTNTSLVKASLLTNDYGYIVFDFYNGLKTFKNNPNYSKENDFKLARIITGGNFHLVGINKTGKPDSTSRIISFSKGSLPDLVYKNVYGDDIYNNTIHLANNSQVNAVLQSGLYNGEKVDYCLISEPALTGTMNNQSAATYGKLNIISSLRDDWKTKTGQNAIPQAGLFIRQDYYNSHKKYYDDQLGLLEERIDITLDNPDIFKERIKKDIPNIEDQKALFGFTADLAFKVQDKNNNGFAFISEKDHKTLSIESFLKSLGESVTDYSDYFLERGLDE